MKVVLPNDIAEEYELKMGYKHVEILKSNDENKCNNFQDYENSKKIVLKIDSRSKVCKGDSVEETQNGRLKKT